MLKIIETCKNMDFFITCYYNSWIRIYFYKRLNFGIDFKGGTQVVFEFGKEFDKQKADDNCKKIFTKMQVTNTVNNT